MLTVTGTPQNDSIRVERNVAGTLAVNGGSIPISGGVPTVVNTTLIRIFGLAGDDVLALDESNGALRPAEITGDAGNDILQGGSFADSLYGGPGRDQLIGGGGNDMLFGGDDDDEFIWNPGDGSDVVEGQGGTDGLVVNGSNASEIYTLVANGSRFQLLRNVAAITMDCAGPRAGGHQRLGRR